MANEPLPSRTLIATQRMVWAAKAFASFKDKQRVCWTQAAAMAGTACATRARRGPSDGHLWKVLALEEKFSPRADLLNSVPWRIWFCRKFRLMWCSARWRFIILWVFCAGGENKLFTAPGDDLSFSVYPVFTAYGTQDGIMMEAGEILHFPVNNYYYGKRKAFSGEEVTKYHRTLTTLSQYTLLQKWLWAATCLN